MFATTRCRLMQSLDLSWRAQQAALPRPDVLLLGLGTHVAYAAPDGSWVEDKQWAAHLDASYDADAVRQAVERVVRQMAGVRVVGGRVISSEEREEGGEGQRQGVPAVEYGIDRQQGTRKVCLEVHKSLVQRVVREVEEELQQVLLEERRHTALGSGGGAAGGGSGRGRGAATQSRGAASGGVKVGRRVKLARRQKEQAQEQQQDSSPGQADSPTEAAVGKDSVTARRVCHVQFVLQPRPPRGQWVTVDVIPAAAGKAAALRHVLQRFGVDGGAVVAAGDTERDAEVLAAAAAAVVTAPRPPPRLRELAAAGVGSGGRGVAVASKTGAAGVLEGLQLLGLL